MEKGFIDYYYEWMETGQLPDEGLCYSLPRELRDTVEFRLIAPTIQDAIALGDEFLPTQYWGCGLHLYDTSPHIRHRGMTPLRETLLILAALLNNEKF